MSATEAVEGLVERVERLTEDAGPEAQELLGAVMELYGEGLERIVEILLEAGDAAAGVRARMLDDGVVASLLLIHDLYPVPLEQRVHEALESVRPYMESHGGGVSVVSLSEQGVLRLALHGSCEGCPASAATLELAIKEALEEAAPDLAGLEVEGVVELKPRMPPMPAPARLAPVGMELPVVQVGGAGPAASPLIDLAPPTPPTPPAPAGWQPLPGVEDLASGALRAVGIGGERIVVARVGPALLAYRDACARCGEPLAGGRLEDGLLTCPGCTAAYSLPMAGRAFDGAGPPLDPVPLLEDPPRVKLP